MAVYRRATCPKESLKSPPDVGIVWHLKSTKKRRFVLRPAVSDLDQGPTFCTTDSLPAMTGQPVLRPGTRLIPARRGLVPWAGANLVLVVFVFRHDQRPRLPDLPAVVRYTGYVAVGV